jgi:hypothetical protein
MYPFLNCIFLVPQQSVAPESETSNFQSLSFSGYSGYATTKSRFLTLYFIENAGTHRIIAMEAILYPQPLDL